MFCYCVGQRPVEMMQRRGGICRSFDSLSTSDGGGSLLFFTSHLSVTADDCLWSMKAHSLFLLSLATEKNLNSQEMKQTKASASAPQMCPPSLQKKNQTLPEHNVVRGQSFDISTACLIHVLLQQRELHFTS